MIRRRSLCVLAFACLAFPLQAQIEENFRSALEALAGGKQDEALELLKQVLAEDPSQEAAYELMQKTEYDVWLKLLTQGGEFEVVTKALMDKARLGRKARANDPDAIRELAKKLASNDVLERNKVVNQLASDYGEYSVPILVYSLAEGANADQRVNVMTALTKMGSDVVPPLIEALEAGDAFLRRNVALTLGYIGDPRARAALARAAANDADTAVRTAAGQALAKVGGPGDAAALYLAQADAYYREDDAVLMPFQYSDVVWHWEGNGLVGIEVPRFLYAPEMAKKDYYRALELAPDPAPALAGIARCAVTQLGRIADWQAAGAEVGEWPARLEKDDLAAQLAGPAALDLALGHALKQNDQVAASGLCRLLAGNGSQPTANLHLALQAVQNGAVRGEAAVALGAIAFRTRTAAGPETLAALNEAASREVVRIGAVIDGDEARRAALSAQLSDQGMFVNSWSRGGRALGALNSIPGVDLLLIADPLPDLATVAVIDELRRNPRTARAPIFVVSTKSDADAGLYGDKVSGVITPGGDFAPIEAALNEQGLNRDREQANDLAARAAATLQRLASSGVSDVSSVAEGLAGTLAARPDGVVLPALGVLEFVGGAGQVERVAGVVANGERSEEVRVRAASALAGIFSRTGTADPGVLKMLQEAALGDASFAVRAATAGALGRLNLSREVRIDMMRALFGR
jgi:HEAT repeat protein/CheY-like chemotaxis protein